MLIIHCEGGIIQSVCTDNEELLKLFNHHLVVIVDYDTEGAEPYDLISVKQGLDKDARCVDALVSTIEVGLAAIDTRDLREKL